MLSAVKLWYSSSISGPVATSKPARARIRIIRRSVRVTGWSPPGKSPRSGSVTSSRSAASSASRRSASSARRRASRISATAAFASLISLPAAGRCSGGKRPSIFSRSVRRPFLPRYLTRTASSCCRSPAARTSASASRSSESRALTRGPSAPRLLCSQRFFGRGGERRKPLLVVDGDVGQDLPIDFDVGAPQAVHEPTVRQAVGARRGVDPRDPERAELPLALTAVAVRVLAGLDDGLLRDPVNLAPRAVVALGFLEDLTMPRLRDDAPLDSGHRWSPSCTAASYGRPARRARPSARSS